MQSPQKTRAHEHGLRACRCDADVCFRVTARGRCVPCKSEVRWPHTHQLYGGRKTQPRPPRPSGSARSDGCRTWQNPNTKPTRNTTSGLRPACRS